MSKRDELQAAWAEYERKLDEVREKAPENDVCEIESVNRSVIAVYKVEHDELEITKRHSNGNVIGSLALSADEAEKLYHFLGGLYG
jgi:radical SAM superfamily enzyme with C-terminal helix-hairpin-helix motif